MNFLNPVKVIFFLFIFSLTSVFSFAQDQTVFYPLLVDLPGWYSEAPQGTNLSHGAMKMTMATKIYVKGVKNITAMVFVGTSQMSQTKIPDYQHDSVTTADGVKVRTKKINGMFLQMIYDSNEKVFTAMVVLGKTDTTTASFSFIAKNVTEKNGEKLFKKYSLAKLKKVSGKMML